MCLEILVRYVMLPLHSATQRHRININNNNKSHSLATHPYDRDGKTLHARQKHQAACQVLSEQVHKHLYACVCREEGRRLEVFALFARVQQRTVPSARTGGSFTTATRADA